MQEVCNVLKVLRSMQALSSLCCWHQASARLRTGCMCCSAGLRRRVLLQSCSSALWAPLTPLCGLSTA